MLRVIFTIVFLLALVGCRQLPLTEAQTTMLYSELAENKSDTSLCKIYENIKKLNGVNRMPSEQEAQYIREINRRNLSCDENASSDRKIASSRITINNSALCAYAIVGKPPRWREEKNIYVREAKRRGLTCGLNKSTTQTASTTETITPKINNISDKQLCQQATFKGGWSSQPRKQQYVEEAKRRGLSCSLQTGLVLRGDDFICERAVSYDSGKQWSDDPDLRDFVIEAKRRGLSCGVAEASGTQTASTTTSSSNSVSSTKDKVTIIKTISPFTFSEAKYKNSSVEVFPKEQRIVIYGHSSHFESIWSKIYESKQAPAKLLVALGVSSADGSPVFSGKPIKAEAVSLAGKKAIRVELPLDGKSYKLEKESPYLRFCINSEGVFLCSAAYNIESKKNEKSFSKLQEILEAIKFEKNGFANTQIASSNSVPSAALTAAQREADELRKKLGALEAKQKQEQRAISNDTRVPLIDQLAANSSGKQGIISGRVRDNTGIAEVTVDGTVVQVGSNGRFEHRTFIPADGKQVLIEATDLAGLTSQKQLRLSRDAAIQSASISFDSLNPLGKRVAKNRDALALIVGVETYEQTPAQAIYADSDAKMFRDYATEKLGILENRIETLINDGAELTDMLLSVKEWLTRSVKQNKTDVYVFFAGHGLASEDGEKMYLLPYDGSPRLLDRTAILRDELFSDIAAANPRSVTVFLDTCYSGTTRGTDMLVASRPIAIRAKQQNIPDSFTVFTAAGGDQTAKPLEEAKHGMFSYFLMKGMEGDADTNRDNQITAAELHEYVEQNVVQQSGGSQVPELQGDAERVLVRFQ